MASYYIRKNSRYFWVQYIDVSGFRKCKSSGIAIDSQNSRRKIISMVQELELLEKDHKISNGSELFRNWVLDWIVYRYTNMRSAWRAKNSWNHLSDFFDLKKIAHPNDVTYSLVHDYMRWRTTKVSDDKNRRIASWNTALTEVRVLGAIMSEAVKRGIIKATPCARLGLQRAKPRAKLEICEEVEAKILQVLEKSPEWMQDCFKVAMKHGCRLSETAVPLHQVDVRAMTITFDVKGGGQHTAALHPALLELVKRKKQQGALHLVDLPSHAKSAWHKWFKRNGFGEYSFHCTRVSVVTRLARAGYSEVQTMQYVGHASDVVHSVYRKLRPNDLRHLHAAL